MDRGNVANHVFVYSTNFVVFDDYLAAKYVAKLNNELKDESLKQEVRYKRIHGRYFFTNEAKVVKLKYVKAHKKERRFQTEYTVASKSGGMALLVSNVDGIDFEENLKNSPKTKVIPLSYTLFIPMSVIPPLLHDKTSVYVILITVMICK